jgi:hypothetical protein
MRWVSARSLARFTAICRLLIGSGFLISPQTTMRPWIGRDATRATGQLLARVVGTRDVVLAVGTLTARESQRRWLAAALVADAADTLLTIQSRDHLPRTGAALVIAVAGGGVALGAVAVAGGNKRQTATSYAA